MIYQTERNLNGLSGCEFQQLIGKLLPRIDKKYKGLVNSGAVEGTAKTRKGKPDIWKKSSNNRLIFVEITTEKKKSKLENDLYDCIPLYEKITEKEYVCIVNYDPQYDWIKPLEEKCKNNNIVFLLFHNSKISEELDKPENHDLRQLFLNIPPNNITVTNIPLGINEIIQITDFSEELKETRNLLNKYHLNACRERAFTLIDKIEYKKSIKEKEELYRIIADSYLIDPVNQNGAIEWLEKLINISDDSVIKNRRKALLLLVQKKIDEAESIIDDLLTTNNYLDNIIELKCNIFLFKKEYREGINFLNSLSVDFKQKDHWYAIYYLANNSFEKAISFAKKSIKQEDTFKNKRVLFDAKIFYIDNQFSKIEVNKEIFADAKEILSDSEYLLKLIGDNIPYEKSDILAKKAIILHWIGRTDEALEIFNQAFTTYPNNPTLLRNRALLFAEKEKYGDALDDINAFLDLIPSDMIGKSIKYRILIQSDPQEANKLLEKEIEKGGNNKQLIILRIEALFAALKTTEALESIKSFKENNNDPRIAIIESEILSNNGNLEDAILVLEKAFGSFSFKIKEEAVLTLSGYYILKNEAYFFQKAKDILEPFVNIYIPSPFLSRYVLCLYNLQFYKECLEYCERIRELHGNFPEYIKYEAAINLIFDNFHIAIPLFTYLINNSIKDVIQYKINLSYCYYRLGEKQKSYDIIEQSINNRLTENDLILISKIYVSYGKSIKAAKYAHKAYTVNKKDKNAIENFIGTILFIDKEGLVIPEEIIKDYQECFQEYNLNYPNSTFLRKIELPTETDKIRIYFQNMLKETKNRTIELEENYSTHHLPISFISIGAGRDLISTYDYILTNKSLSIWGDSGNLNKLSEECQIVQANSECYIDLISILLLFDIGLIKSLKFVFNKIYIQQFIIDEINKEIDILDQSISSKQSYMMLDEKEQVHLIKISDDYTRKNISRLNQLREILKDVDNNFQIVGRELIRDDYHQFIDILNILDKSDSQVIINAKITKKPIFINSYVIREILKTDKFSIESFGLFAIFSKLFIKRIISIKQFYNYIIKLISINYKYTTFDDNLIFYAIKTNGYINNESTKMVLNLLADMHWDEKNIFQIIINLLCKLWSEPVTQEIISEWTRRIIFKIADRCDIKTLCKIFIDNLKKENPNWGKKKRSALIKILDDILAGADHARE